MRKIVFSLLALAALPALSGGETVVLRSGGFVSGKITQTNGKFIILDKKNKIPLARVDEILFGGAAPKPAVAVPARPQAPTKADEARGKELFALARQYSAAWPGADGVILSEEAGYCYKENGTWTYRYRFIGQVLKESLLEDWSLMSEPLESSREKLRIVKATVYRPDGKIIPFNPANLREASPQGEDDMYAANGSADYSFPLVCPGAIIEYETERETWRPFRADFFFPRWTFRTQWPVRESSLEISVPKASPFYYSAANFTGQFAAAQEPSIRDEGGRLAYRWTMRDVPPLPAEPAMPPMGDGAPEVKASLFKDWGKVYDWLSKMYEARMSATPEMAAKAAELVKGALTDEEKAARLYHYVQSDIRYIGVKMGVASTWGGYAAADTWRRRYGCCIDKALLFCSLLKTQKIACSPVILDTNLSPRHDFSLPDIEFEHAIVWLRAGGKDIYLDPTGYDFRYPAMDSMNYGVRGLNVLNRRVDFIPNLRPEDNATSYNYDIAIDAGGGTQVKFSSTYNGPREGELRALYKSKDAAGRRQIFTELAGEISPGAILRNWNTANVDTLSAPLSIDFEYYARTALSRAGDLAIFTLPDFAITADEAALDARQSDIVYPAPFSKRYHYSLALPAQMRVLSLPAPMQLKNPHGGFKLSCLPSAEKIACDALLEISSRAIPAADYAEFKTFIEAAARASLDRIFLKTDVSGL